MPRTTKEITEKEKTLSLSSTSTKKSVSKSVAKKTSSVKKIKAESSVKKASSATKKTKTTASKKATSNKSPSRTKTVKKTDAKKSNTVNVLEYYDLPYRYNQTIVKILAQTPKRLFVYWDISDEDRKNYINQYGENFFENTKPVLIIHNKTMNYTFEIEINDFANCWYFDINDEKCEYLVELGRKSKEFNNENIQIPNNYLYITSSNEIESPNGHILFEKGQNTVFFRNVKTKQEFSKDIANFEFIKFFGKTYKAYDIYKKIYKDEDLLNLDNPSSSFKIY